MATEEESIEQAAASRRERLKALKAAQELLNAPDEDSVQAAENQTDETNEEDNPSMKFRNYVPHDKQLQEGKVAPPVLPKFEDPGAAAPPAPEEKRIHLSTLLPRNQTGIFEGMCRRSSISLKGEHRRQYSNLWCNGLVLLYA
ncbi:uncharacterized protein LOC120130323 isoform X2 [Hibiscus syriacus]|uniref:uncharacterized protein LOC120130323 isoform X2 n=1 Tax=Hibiscus syriacus TaxID=106335 RepID=UPI0019242E39|nr:uncharacterized protein LOC120130323 isoform X2 [Hibiscus syriacus]